ncbi:DEKNAAC101567 [Brettanomyces naardenensis]|uniref:choline-phosphate cytidylyltransferase n=1 Tax=Brettanomyces naardenensis TaxID=13370 RepID=A0A448YIM2_BRENA|nr:DEKNAAC101567 [Brettanomyces naardenensis]
MASSSPKKALKGAPKRGTKRKRIDHSKNMEANGKKAKIDGEAGGLGADHDEAAASLAAREELWDSELPAEYRKFRPKGYRLKPPPTDRPVRVYADGVFDLFHLGHMRQLEQCKKAFPNVHLIVGIPNDKETHSRKGLTVLTDEQRYETVRHCKWVDEVLENAPWIITMDFVRSHNIDYCAHDDIPYVADGIEDIYKPMKEAGIFVATQRTEGISTSDIITKIIRDYDKYLLRNFARGATRKELNVSWLKKNELDLKKQVNDFRDSWKNYNDSISNKSKDLYTLVREVLRRNTNRARHNIPVKAPIDKFALKYNANGLSRTSSHRSLFDNLKEWIKLDDHDDYKNMDEYDVYVDDRESPDTESLDERIPKITVKRKRRTSFSRRQSK